LDVVHGKVLIFGTDIDAKDLFSLLFVVHGCKSLVIFIQGKNVTGVIQYAASILEMMSDVTELFIAVNKQIFKAKKMLKSFG